MPGIFTISLDFELHWGGFEKWPLGNGEWRMENGKLDDKFDLGYVPYFLKTRKVIPEMLRLFEQHGVHVTWATVGMLFHESKAELLANVPAPKPSYVEQKLSAYHYIEHEGIGANEAEDPFHFAASLINQIIKTPGHELGTHTFAHYYCNEPGQTVEQFAADLQAAQRAAAKYGVVLKSLVFPRNQFNDQYLQACYQAGITSVRSNPLDWFWHIESTQGESAWKRLNRGLDAYFPIGKKNTYELSSLEIRSGFPVCIPASRLLRPYRPKEFILNDFKIARIKSEMTRAAQQNEVYHLWWHPHNFGNFPEQNMIALSEILKHYLMCQSDWQMQSYNMSELAGMILKEKY